MSSKVLLREWNALSYTPEMIKESRDNNGGKIILNGILQCAGKKNQNNRVYSRDILSREIENYMKAVRENRAVGQLDHPESSTVELDKVSHIVREMRWDGDNVMGKIEVLPTPKGKTLEALLGAGVTVGISSRGVGSTEKTNEGIDMVQPDFQLIAFDVVGEPSTPGAYLFRESKLIDFDPRSAMTRADRIYRALNDIVRK